MGLRTSIYLRDEVAAKWRASGVPLAELVLQALEAGEDGLALRVGRAALRAAGHAVSDGAGTTGVPPETAGSGTAPSGTATQVPESSGAGHDGTGSVHGGTRVAPKAKAAPGGKAARPEVLAGIPLTVASDLPKPRRCTHPGKRSVGGFCAECDHLIRPGGMWA